MYADVAIAVADDFIGVINHWLKSRKKALFIFYLLTVISIAFLYMQDGGIASRMYLICAAMGFGTGFWAIFVTMVAEQFGTNLRATAATTVPNMVRGSLPLMLLFFNGLQHYTSYVNAALYTGILVMIVSITSDFFTKETFGKDLNYIEE